MGGIRAASVELRARIRPASAPSPRSAGALYAASGSPSTRAHGRACASSAVAWPAARPPGSSLKRGFAVELCEQKPTQRTPAQTSDRLAELVCSNSLRSANPENAVGLLKEELSRCGSLLMACADRDARAGGRRARGRSGALRRRRRGRAASRSPR